VANLQLKLFQHKILGEEVVALPADQTKLEHVKINAALMLLFPPFPSHTSLTPYPFPLQFLLNVLSCIITFHPPLCT